MHPAAGPAWAVWLEATAVGIALYEALRQTEGWPGPTARSAPASDGG